MYQYFHSVVTFKILKTERFFCRGGSGHIGEANPQCAACLFPLYVNLIRDSFRFCGMDTTQ